MISINLSARQLAEEETLVPHVVDALRRHDLSPETLGFEVTESMRIDDPEIAAGTLRTLSGLGCRIAVDDFGIGYATLDYLRHFSMADIIKIDRSFVAGLGRSKEDTAIVHASLALAYRSRCGWWPRGWRRPSSSSSWARWAATTPRATCSARPSPSTPPSSCGASASWRAPPWLQR